MKRYARMALPLLRPQARPIWDQKSYHTIRQPGTAVLRPRLPTRRYYSGEQKQAPAKACPSCGSPLEMKEITCGKCGSLSPLPEDVNYLALFGLKSEQPFEFDIDLGQLRREYIKLMSKIHPDSVINKPDVTTISFISN